MHKVTKMELDEREKSGDNGREGLVKKYIGNSLTLGAMLATFPPYFYFSIGKTRAITYFSPEYTRGRRLRL